MSVSMLASTTKWSNGKSYAMLRCTLMSRTGPKHMSMALNSMPLGVHRSRSLDAVNLTFSGLPS